MGAPTAWQMLLSVAAVSGFMALLVTCGIIYGKITARIESLEKAQGSNAARSEVVLMFEDIKGQLRRIEEEVVDARGRAR